MKILYLVFLTWGIYSQTIAQCPPGSLSLLTQAQVNQFLLDYPNCTNLNGDLYIASNDVTDISAFSLIQSINGDLSFHQTNCINANFPNLTSVNGHIYFHQNYLLENANFPNLVGTISYIYFHQNTNLINITLCSVLNTSDYLYFHQNSSLLSLCLDDLISVGGHFYLLGSNLSNLSTLQNLQSINEYLYLVSNPNLSNCEGICMLLNNNGVNGSITISNNPSQCSSLSEVQTVCLALPIVFSKPLVAKNNLNTIILNWSVTTQINNNKYIIEHSKDGKDFSPIGEIAGDGTNNAELYYTYTHKTPSIGVNYYRIKQIDYDGQYSYSNIASVEYEGDYSEIAIYPNPATDEVKIYTPNNTKLTITDIYGRTVKTLSIIEGENSLDIKELPSGFYIFALQNGDRYKILKE